MSDLHEVSDGCFGLMQLMNSYGDHVHELKGSDVHAIAVRLSELGGSALRLENEVSRHRWNELARREAVERAAQEKARLALETEASQPGSNLVLLSFERPFSDGGAR